MKVESILSFSDSTQTRCNCQKTEGESGEDIETEGHLDPVGSENQAATSVMLQILRAWSPHEPHSRSQQPRSQGSRMCDTNE